MAEKILALLSDITDVGGTLFQPLDSDLTAIAALVPTDDDIIQRKASAWTNRTMAQLAADLNAPLDAFFLTPAEGNAAYQPLDADLTSWAGVTRAAGFDTFAATPSSANLATLVTGETGSGALVFGTAPALSSPVLTTPDIGTPSAGVLTNCTGLPLASVVDSTTEALGVGSLEVGHASDTTISRAEAGVIQVETDPLYTNLPQNSQSAAYTTVLADKGKHILHPTADNNARTFTIAANASVAYPIGTVITFVNQINTVTIAIDTDTLTLQGAGTTGSRTLAANGYACVLKVAATAWIIAGVGLT